MFVFFSLLHHSITPILHHSNDCVADHRVSIFPCSPWPPPGAPERTPGGGCSGCKFGGPPSGTYFLIHSSNAGPRGKRPGTMFTPHTLASMMVTFGSPEIGMKSLVAPPFTGPDVPK